MAGTLHAFDYLATPTGEHPPTAVCVLFGDEPLLKRLALARLRGEVLGEDGEDVPYAMLDGAEAEWRDVHDELATVSLFGAGRRLVVVDDADKFVSKYREQLEKYVAQPARGSVLILRVNPWAANTRLYKLVAKSGLQVDCRLPRKGRGVDEAPVRKWLTQRAKTEHGIQIGREAMGLLFDLVDTDLGLLDQELAKLALYVDKTGKVSMDLVRDVSGGWRTKTTWEIVDQAADGNAGEALAQLDKLLATGEKPIALYGSFAWSLRRLAAATRIYEQKERSGDRVRMREALGEAGYQNFLVERAEKQLRQLGRERAGQLYRRLLDIDLAMKLSHSQDDRARLLLEQLFVSMSREADPRRK